MRQILVLSLLMAGCSSPAVDLEKERSLVIAQLIDLPNQALVDRNPEKAISAVPEEGDVFIAQGEIFRRTKDEEKRHMEDEIRDVEYRKFTYLSEPSIKFLSGGLACYGTAQVKIDYALTSDSSRMNREFVYSILFVGEKRDDKWVMTAFSQSDKPEVLNQ